jgi:hypothetical protein
MQQYYEIVATLKESSYTGWVVLKKKSKNLNVGDMLSVQEWIQKF